LEEFIGVILKKINYKESSEIIYLYTKNGLESILVHGSRNMKSPNLNLPKILNMVKVTASGKNLKVLREGEVINQFSHLSDNLEKYTYLLHLVETIYYFSTHEHDHEKLLNFLIKILLIIEKNDNYIPYINMVELKLLYLLGVNPNFTSCLICAKTENLVFSVKDGSVFCQEHKPELFVSNKILQTLKYFYYFDVNQSDLIVIEDSHLRDVRMVIDDYYSYHLNYSSKSRKMLKGLIGY
jgi:DNA repair protein RecO (recombination protein O)